jgi:thioredoxin-related protein|tara:strand:- start:477 stop:980 length:504 start_codon:yes stop_codon:yes gene_type:complete
MIKKIFKLIIISNLFVLAASAKQKIMLDDSDIITSPLPLPYNGSEYSTNDLNEFISNTITKDKQPIIIFGANWCPDCRIFSATMDIPKIKSYIDKNFEVLYVDVKRYEINMSLMEEFGIEPAEGIPRLLIFDKNRKLINSSNTTEWRTARDRTSQEIFNFFQDMNIN